MLRAPVLSEAFFQVDLVDGFGFLDVRGELIRRFHDEFQSFSETLEENGPSALLFERPLDPEHPLVAVKVGIGVVWAHIRAEATFTGIRQECSRVTEAACAIIGSTQFSRQGLRTYHLFGADTPDDAVAAVRHVVMPAESAWTALGTIGSAGLNLQFVAERLKVNLRLAPIQMLRTRIVTDMAGGASAAPKEPDERTPRIGVLLDVDVFDDSRSDTRDPKPHLNRAVNYIEERSLPLVTRLIRQG